MSKTFRDDTLEDVMKALLAAISMLLVSGILSSCGGHVDCSTYSVLSVGPMSGTANHSAKAPGNTTLFQASISQQLVHPSNSCVLPALGMLVQPSWTVSNPTQANISSAKDTTNGRAICLAASSSPITVTATVAGLPSPLTATATLNCE